jgi:hypothetical protein
MGILTTAIFHSVLEDISLEQEFFPEWSPHAKLKLASGRRQNDQ